MLVLFCNFIFHRESNVTNFLNTLFVKINFLSRIFFFPYSFMFFLNFYETEKFYPRYCLTLGGLLFTIWPHYFIYLVHVIILSYHFTWAFLVLYLAKQHVEIYSSSSSNVPTEQIIYAQHFMRDPGDPHTELRDFYVYYFDFGKRRSH